MDRNTFFEFMASDIVFDGADNLWSNFQTKILEFVKDQGGTGFINEPIRNRPDYDTVREVLQGTHPISDLGC